MKDVDSWRGGATRRALVAALAASGLAAASGGVSRAQPSAADPVSFYLGQTLALATLQAEAVGRLRPFLAVPAPQDVDWQAMTAAEAGVIGAVAAVLGAMEAPAELGASVGELRLASLAYQGAAKAAQSAAAGEAASLGVADAGLQEGAGHILLWLGALTAETGNDWGDGLRSLTLGAAPAALDEIAIASSAEAPVDIEVDDPGDGAPADGEGQARRQGQGQQLRQSRQQASPRAQDAARQ